MEEWWIRWIRENNPEVYEEMNKRFKWIEKINESRARELEAERDYWHKLADRRSAEIIRLTEERDRLKFELEYLQARIYAPITDEIVNSGEAVDVTDKDGIPLERAVLKRKYIDLRARHAALVEAAEPFVSTFHHTIVFLQSREKMHNDGVKSYENDVNKLKAALSEVKG
jgi:hypothetical protein